MVVSQIIMVKPKKGLVIPLMPIGARRLLARRYQTPLILLKAHQSLQSH